MGGGAETSELAAVSAAGGLVLFGAILLDVRLAAETEAVLDDMSHGRVQ